MQDELNRAIEEYRHNWQLLVEQRHNRTFFENQKPTAVAWKMKDADELHARFSELRDLCDQIHFGWVNERWLITMRLKGEPLNWGMSVIKLMQRRPGSSDATGLDHVDFYSAENDAANTVLQAESDLKWNEERNGEHCKWTSVWFAGVEAKIRTDTVLAPCIAELQDIETALTASA